MKGDPIPLREGILPEYDGEREMVDYCQGQIRAFAQQFGTPPSRAAIVLMGSKDDEFATRTHSWDSDGKAPRVVTCSVAASLLLKRATDA